METIVHSARLTLRRNQPDDVDAMHAIFADRDVARMTASWPWPPDRAFTASRCDPLPPADGMAGLIRTHDGTPVGGMGIHRMGADIGMGYAIARAHWGRGYATEMGRALIDHIWSTYDWDTITASVLDDNPASMRVLEKLGFAAIGPTTCPSAARGPGDYPARAFRLTRP